MAKAMVDYIAEDLSKRTGTTFTVHRRRVNGKLGYALTAERDILQVDGTTFKFKKLFNGPRAHNGSITLREMTTWLASINDMVVWGILDPNLGTKR